PDRAKAHSPRFTKDDTKIDNSTSVLASEQLATKAVAVFSSSGFRRCMTRLADHALAKEKQKDPKFTSVLAHTAISVVPQTLSLPADQEAGLAVTITLTTKNGLTFDERVAFDVARVGRALENYNIQYGPNSAGPLPSSVFTPSLERLRTALQADAPAA